MKPLFRPFFQIQFQIMVIFENVHVSEKIQKKWTICITFNSVCAVSDSTDAAFNFSESADAVLALLEF